MRFRQLTTIVSTLALSGCATKDYINESIAALNTKIEAINKGAGQHAETPPSAPIGTYNGLSVTPMTVITDLIPTNWANSARERGEIAKYEYWQWVCMDISERNHRKARVHQQVKAGEALMDRYSDVFEALANYPKDRSA